MRKEICEEQKNKLTIRTSLTKKCSPSEDKLQEVIAIATAAKCDDSEICCHIDDKIAKSKPETELSDCELYSFNGEIPQYFNYSEDLQVDLFNYT